MWLILLDLWVDGDWVIKVEGYTMTGYSADIVDIVQMDQTGQESSSSGNSEQFNLVTKRTWKPIDHNDMKISKQ